MNQEFFMTIQFAITESSLGHLLIAQSEVGLCALFFGSSPNELKQELQERFPKTNLNEGDASFKDKLSQVISFVENPSGNLDILLDLHGTNFQIQVWKALQKIPAGTTVSYTTIAKKIGSPKAVRAVAKACAANHLAVVIPCHRVVRSDGSISGYRWGVDRKKILLEREKF